MKKTHLVLTLAMAITLLLFSACCDKQTVKKVYIEQECPKLRVFDVNLTELTSFDVNYTIKER